VKSLDVVKRQLKDDGRAAAVRTAAAAQQLRRRGEAQLGQSSPTVVWRKPSTR